MPLRNIENWTCTEIMAPVLSFVMAFFRVMYERNEQSACKRFLESLICGLITLSCGFAIDAMGFSNDWKYVVGGAVGYFGTDYVKGLAQKILNKKTDEL